MLEFRALVEPFFTGVAATEAIAEGTRVTDVTGATVDTTTGVNTIEGSTEANVTGAAEGDKTGVASIVTIMEGTTDICVTGVTTGANEEFVSPGVATTEAAWDGTNDGENAGTLLADACGVMEVGLTGGSDGDSVGFGASVTTGDAEGFGASVTTGGNVNGFTGGSGSGITGCKTAGTTGAFDGDTVGVTGDSDGFAVAVGDGEVEGGSTGKSVRPREYGKHPG